MTSAPRNINSLVASVCGITQLSEPAAYKLLEASTWDVNAAVDTFYGSGGAEVSDGMPGVAAGRCERLLPPRAAQPPPPAAVLGGGSWRGHESAAMTTRPPTDIVFPGDFDAMREAARCARWLLVNIQVRWTAHR